MKMLRTRTCRMLRIRIVASRFQVYTWSVSGTLSLSFSLLFPLPHTAVSHIVQYIQCSPAHLSRTYITERRDLKRFLGTQGYICTRGTGYASSYINILKVAASPRPGKFERRGRPRRIYRRFRPDERSERAERAERAERGESSRAYYNRREIVCYYIPEMVYQTKVNTYYIL